MTVRNNCGVGLKVSRLGGIALSGLLGTTFLCGTAIPALAMGGDRDTLDLSNLERLSDASLKDMRGGFMIGGFDISFGVTITTTVNGATVLQTSFNITNPGQIADLATTVVQNAQSAATSAGAGNGNNSGSGSNGGPVSVDVAVKVNVDPVQQAVDEFQQTVDKNLNGGASSGGTQQLAALPPPVDGPAVDGTLPAVQSTPTTTSPPSADAGGQQTSTAGNQAPPATGSAGTGPDGSAPTLDPVIQNNLVDTAQGTIPQVLVPPSADTSDPGSTPASSSASQTADGGVPPSANPGNTGAQPGFQEGSTTPLPPTGPTGAATGGGNAPASLGSETAPQGNAPTTVASDLGAWIVSQLSDGSGVKLTSADLATTIIQRFGNGHGFTTDITNSANDRTFTNTTDMNLFLNNFAQVSAQALTSQLLTNLTVDMAHQSALGN